MKKSGKSIQMVLALLAAGTLLLNGCSAAKPAEKKSIRIGVTLYRGDDALSTISVPVWRKRRRNMSSRRASRLIWKSWIRRETKIRRTVR